MLKFQVYDNGAAVQDWPVRNAHLIGSDNSAMRGDITFEEGLIQVNKRELGSASLAIQQPVGDCGELTIQTTLLPDREDPYLLSLEQARHRLMMLYNKLEDWGMFDLDIDHPIHKRLEQCKLLFIDSLCHQGTDPVKADSLAKECLINAIDASEELALIHAQSLLNRRKSAGVLPKYAVGCSVTLAQDSEPVRSAILSNFDFVYLPTPWKELSVAEGEYRWETMDDWVQWAAKNRVPMVGGPLVSFDHHVLPEWIYIWEHDYDALRDLIYEHTERIVTRYKNSIRAWNTVSGLHVNSQFNFSFDQLMDLSRMSTMLVKKIQPAAKVLIEIRQPFGEYYGQNQRSIPPLMYSDLLVQGGINFDAFIIKVLMGQAVSGQYTRDLMQISNLLDQFAVFGKPVHVVVAAPSDPVMEWMISQPGEEGDEPLDPDCGHWRTPWSQGVQSRWLGALFGMAMSKPFVETVSWNELIDHTDAELPLGGLVSEEQQPKKAFQSLIDFRKALTDKDSANGFESVFTLNGKPLSPTHG